MRKGCAALVDGSVGQVTFENRVSSKVIISNIANISNKVIPNERYIFRQTHIRYITFHIWVCLKMLG